MKKKIEKLIIKYLKEKKYKYKKTDGDTINVNFKIKDNRVLFYIVAQEDGWMVFSSSDKLMLPWDIGNKSLLALTIAKINFYTRKGSFQFDESDGEIRYKIFSGLSPKMICKETIDTLLERDIDISINMIIRHQGALLEATKGNGIVEDLFKYELQLSDLESMEDSLEKEV